MHSALLLSAPRGKLLNGSRSAFFLVDCRDAPSVTKHSVPFTLCIFWDQTAELCSNVIEAGHRRLLRLRAVRFDCDHPCSDGFQSLCAMQPYTSISECQITWLWGQVDQERRLWGSIFYSHVCVLVKYGESRCCRPASTSCRVLISPAAAAAAAAAGK